MADPEFGSWGKKNL